MANQKKVWFLSYIDSNKRIFPRRRANGVAPTVEQTTSRNLQYIRVHIVYCYIDHRFDTDWELIWRNLNLPPFYSIFVFYSPLSTGETQPGLRSKVVVIWPASDIATRLEQPVRVVLLHDWWQFAATRRLLIQFGASQRQHGGGLQQGQHGGGLQQGQHRGGLQQGQHGGQL